MNSNYSEYLQWKQLSVPLFVTYSSFNFKSLWPFKMYFFAYLIIVIHILVIDSCPIDAHAWIITSFPHSELNLHPCLQISPLIFLFTAPNINSTGAKSGEYWGSKYIVNFSLLAVVFTILVRWILALSWITVTSLWIPFSVPFKDFDNRVKYKQ